MIISAAGQGSFIFKMLMQEGRSLVPQVRPSSLSGAGLESDSTGFWDKVEVVLCLSQGLFVATINICLLELAET